MYSKNYVKNQNIVSIIGIVAFFLPWISISLFNMDGMDIASMGFLGLQSLYFVPLAFISNMVIVNSNKPDLMYVKSILFVIPFFVMFMNVKDLFIHLGVTFESIKGSEFISLLFESFSYGFYITIAAIIGTFLITDGVSDVDDPNFGEI